ncbi:hypothetical protein BCR37DRAFT_292569 [Protomyces lactucae-debilis]|uniref:Uncharacterized protein n=1 Tax=Protomyces lactucae-debilis TaxID=2754530 RepID=A0A1Y2FGM7_PROLT|nr:uncharacterized protein BCR37DRAFT_292569 [Protomyces lactucae-debilis]ORY83098.1 hypothetical protein BCR37DRAFT_292569 [Protomyces lactucae-debilis]
MAHGQGSGLPPVAGSQSTLVNLPRSTYLPIVFAPHYQAPGYVEGQSSFPPPPLTSTQPGGGAAAIAQQLFAPGSRNSSTSTASGQSERRISVMSLISPDASNASTAVTSIGGQEGIINQTTNGYSASGNMSTATPGPATGLASSTPETDARDSYYYNYYMTVHAMTLTRNNLVPDAAPGLWTQTIPGLINEDPPGKRALFDALIALTAHTRGEEVAIPFETRSVGPLASLIELGIKCLVDIYRDTTETLSRADVFHERTDEPVQRHFRWQILYTLVVCNLSDARTRKNWVNYLADKAFNKGCMTAASESQHFFLCCLRELMFTGGALPRQPSATLLEFRSKYELLAIPGMDLIYFAMCQDYTALRGICYRILSSPRAEYLLLAGNLLRGAQLRGEPGLETLLADLHRAADKIKY